MEQEIGVVATLLGWAVEEIFTLLVGSAIGAIGAKWFFGRKNSAALKQLRLEVEQLKGNRNDQAPSSLATSDPAPSDSSGKTIAIASAADSNPPNALLTPKELLDLVKGHTGIMAEQLLKPHKGRRYHVQGVIEDVNDYGIDRLHVSLDGKDKVSFVLWFDHDSHKEVLETLRRGDEVSATGLLQHASNHIALEKCSIDNVDRSGTHQDS